MRAITPPASTSASGCAQKHTSPSNITLQFTGVSSPGRPEEAPSRGLNPQDLRSQEHVASEETVIEVRTTLDFLS